MEQSRRVILHVFPSQSWGGAEIYSVQLAKSQKDSGENVIYWAAPGSQIEKEARQVGLKVIIDPLKERIDFSVIKIAQILKSNHVTHVHLHWSGGVWSFGLAKLAFKFKLFLHVHLWMKHSKKDPLHYLLYRTLDGLIVAGEQARRAAAKCIPISKSKIKVSPYAIQQSQVTPISREEIDLEASDFVIGVFSRIDRQKGILELLKAIAEMQVPGLKLLIVGDPTHQEEASIAYFAELKKFSEQNFDIKTVQFHGFKKNFRDWLSVCDIMALPSYHESYSLVILEAFALGIPVLSTAAGGTPDLIDLQRGWLVSPENVESLKMGLTQALKELHQIPAKGLIAKDYVLRNHSFESVNRQLNEIYEGKGPNNRDDLKENIRDERDEF